MENKSPNSRFRKFKQKWTTTPLGVCFTERKERSGDGELISVTINTGIRKAKELDRAVHICDTSNYKVVRQGDIAYNSMRMWQGASGYSPYNGILSPAYTVITPRQGFHSEFFAALFKTPELIHTFELNSQGLTSDTWNLKYDKLKEIKVTYPDNPDEQLNIARFFNKLDSLITSEDKKTEKLKKIKSASLAKMFPKRGEKRPQIRFESFDGDWDEYRLKDITQRITRKNNNLESDLILTISAQHGLIAQEEFFNRRIASAQLQGYYLVKKGEFAYNKSYSSEYPVGAVKCLTEHDMGVLSSLYIVFSLADNIDPYWFSSYFETSNWHNEILKRASEGARNHGLLNISSGDFFDIPILIPKEKDEQKFISDYFFRLDSLITAQEQKVNKIRSMKKSFLEKMFVSNPQ